MTPNDVFTSPPRISAINLRFTYLLTSLSTEMNRQQASSVHFHRGEVNGRLFVQRLRSQLLCRTSRVDAASYAYDYIVKHRFCWCVRCDRSPSPVEWCWKTQHDFVWEHSRREKFLHVCEKELHWLDVAADFKRSYCLRIGCDTHCVNLRSMTRSVLPLVDIVR